MINSMKVTDNEIKFAEKILLPKECFFDIEERVPIIKNLEESFDVNACPGSGKTTVLLAKLIIISQKLDFNNGTGICVLTHTNVAINEVKNKLGNICDTLFKYPNYFGTIDSFVNKFLTIPFYKMIFSKDINIIDSNIYYDEFEHILKKINKGIDSSLIKEYKKVADKSTYVLDNNLNISIEINEILNNSIDKNVVKNIMIELISNGYLRYKDTFKLAVQYFKINKQIKTYFDLRFKYVFIDEMQDTKKYQQEVLAEIFNKTVIQRFGDWNQDIGSGEEDEACGWIKGEVPIKTINTSMRYGQNISKYLNDLTIVECGKIIGSPSVNSFFPHIIIFDDESVYNVRHKFNELIKKYGLDKNKNEVFKAIGKIGQKTTLPNLTINSYYEEYRKIKANKNIKVYEKLIFECYKSEYPLILLENILEILINILRKKGTIINLKQYKELISKKYSVKFLDLRKKTIKWYNDIKVDENKVINEIIKESVFWINIIDNSISEKDILSYFQFDEAQLQVNREVAITKNNDDVKVVCDTVHGVKGETHNATLFMQTIYGKNNNLGDIDHIIDYIIGEGNNEIKLMPEIKQALTITYVAMSRAKHLVCIAIRYNSIKGKIKKLKDKGYIIESASEELLERIKGELHQCPNCGGYMVPRINSKSGSRFYGCVNFPDCRETFKNL